MRPDTSSYYPDSPNSEPSDNARFMPGHEEDSFIPSEAQPIPAPEDVRAAHCPEDGADEATPCPVRTPENKPEWERGVDTLCHILSWVFVPLMMPLYGTLLLFTESPLAFTPYSTRLVVTFVVLGLTAIIPMLLVCLLKRLGLVDDLGLNGRKERQIPYIISIVTLGLTAGYFMMKHAPIWAAMFFAGGAVGGLVNLIVNFKWKISAHSAGIAGVVAMLVRLGEGVLPAPGILWWIMVSVLVAGALGSARVWLGRHTIMQVLAGYAVGFLSVYFMMMIH